MPKKYRLLKDLPDLKAGAVSVCYSGDYYMFGDLYGYSQAKIEAAPGWFEEIKEPTEEERVYTWLVDTIGCINIDTKIKLVERISKALVEKGFRV